MAMTAPAIAAFLLAAAVTIHNVEEMIWLPGFRAPDIFRLAPDPFALRFAATCIAGFFWLLAAALAGGLPVEPVLVGFAAAMLFNAVVPHAALTVYLQRYHPGTASAWLVVVPASVLSIAAALRAEPLAAGAAAIAFAGLALSVPLLLKIGSLLPGSHNN